MDLLLGIVIGVVVGFGGVACCGAWVMYRYGGEL
jgi:hypothetical protein